MAQPSFTHNASGLIKSEITHMVLRYLMHENSLSRKSLRTSLELLGSGKFLRLPETSSFEGR